MHSQLKNDPNSPMLATILSCFSNLALTGLTAIGAYQAGYVLLSMCLIAWIPSIIVVKFFAYVFSIPFNDWEKHWSALLPLTLLTSSLLQSSILLVLVSCLLLASNYLDTTNPSSEKEMPPIIVSWLAIVAISYFAFNPILASVCALSQLECLTVILVHSTINLISCYQKPVDPTTSNASATKQPHTKSQLQSPLHSSSCQPSQAYNSHHTPGHNNYYSTGYQDNPQP